MKERPILMNGAMVRAVLAGTKTQTRRIVKGIALSWLDAGLTPEFVCDEQNDIHPYGRPGDRIWVRETFADIGCRLTYRADEDDGAHCKVKRWIPSIHMPRADSRILLEIASVRVERLNAISENDCWAEGIDSVDGMLDDLAIINMAKQMGRCWEDAAPTFGALWESINGAGSWAVNPWVWVIEFKRVTP